MDWTKTGRVYSFEFMWVNPANLDDETGGLEGVTGGSLTFGYDTDEQVSGSLSLTCEDPDALCGMLRVYALSTLDGSAFERVELATCYASAGEMERLHGRWRGTLELRGPLSRYKDDCINGVWTAAKGSTWKKEWKAVFSRVGGAHLWRADLPDKEVGASKTLDFGSTQLDRLEAIRKAVGGRLTSDSHGRVVMERYVAPAKRALAGRLPEGEDSVTLAGVTLASPAGPIPNRVVVRWKRKVKVKRYVLDEKGNKVKYKSGDKKGKYKTKTVTETRVGYGKAAVAATSAYSKAKTGKWVTAAYDVTNPSKYDGKVDLNKTAAAKLAALVSAKATYTIEHYFLPIRCGEVWELEQDGLHVQGMVVSMEMELSPGLPCTTELRHVRRVS